MIRKLLNCILVLGAVLLSGCTDNTLNEQPGGGLDFSDKGEVTLTGISTTAIQSKATGSTPLAVGETFRLYVFPKGVADMDKLVATRTYTIESVAGDPVMDAGQDPLYLPIGEMDAFLVGPVKFDQNEGKTDENNNPLPPAILDVATATGVFPHFGVDLISSKTVLNVKAGANQFQAEPLEHRMAQMEIVVSRPDDATYTELNVTAISVMNQTLTGEFIFSSTGGEITPAEEGTVTLSPEIRTITPEKEFRSTMYVIPRKNIQLRIGVFLSCKNVDENNAVDRRLESGVMTEPIVAGQMNRFSTKPYLSSKLIFRLRLSPWNDSEMGGIDVPSLDRMLFSYNGMDAPRMIDGKMCIPDRSGNGNHGEIVGDIRHNAQEYYYYAASEGAYIRVSALGNVPVYTLEFAGSSARGAKTLAVMFTESGAERTLGIHLPWGNNEIYFDAGDVDPNSRRLTVNNNFNDLKWMENWAVYSFTRDASNQTIIRRNGITLGTKTIPSHNGLMTDNKLLYLEKNNTDDTKKLRMYAARMSTTSDIDMIQTNYRNDVANFVGVDVNKDETKRDYIQNGLVLDLRGTNALRTDLVSGKQVWEDKSLAKNHAVVMSSSAPTRSGNSYKFDGTSQYMKLLHSLGNLQQYTIEVVAKAAPGNTTLLNFSSNLNGGDNNREFHIHLPWNNEVVFNAPYTVGRIGLQFVKNIDNLTYSFTYQQNNPNQWSIIRQNEGNRSTLSAWLNESFEGQTSSDKAVVREMSHCFIGFNGSNGQWFNSSIYAIRVYSRPLTELERQHNYQTDKKLYNLVP